MILNWLPQDVSTFGPRVDSIITQIVYSVGICFILTEGVLLAFILLYRRKPGRRAFFNRGESAKELAWVLVPAFVVTCLDIAIDVRAASVWRQVKEVLPEAVLTVKVTAVQFGWEFTYPGPDGRFGTADDLLQTNTLVVPAGKVIRLIITSKDVIHSFYSPVLRLKQDAVPGREIPAWFEVTRSGKYEIACAQLCGISHFAMKGILLAQTPDEFQRWVGQHWPKAGGQGAG